jgi:ATP-dependent DNA helicase RecG
MMENRFLSSPIEYLKGVGPQRGELLRKHLHLHCYKDLLEFFPFRYIDRSILHKITDIRENTSFVQLKGKITDLKIVGEKKNKRLTAKFTDHTGSIQLVWFQSIDWILKTINPHVEYLIFGKPQWFKGVVNIPHPELEPILSPAVPLTKGLQPIYSSTETLRKKYLDSKGIQKLTHQLVQQLKESHLPDFLPPYLVEKYQLMSRCEAFKNIHFPTSQKSLHLAQQRLKFEELFLLQMKLQKQKSLRLTTSKGFVFTTIGKYFNDFYHQHLKFKLTSAQERVLKEIRRDTLSGKQMNRLLQGDVGSGKTLVALMSMLMAIDNGFQACLLAPTEILAAQHHQTITSWLQPMNIPVDLLTGSTKTAERKKILTNLKEGNSKIIIGTHALLEDPVQFHHLGLAIIDEQHRFGVAQRAKLWTKNTQPPHVLVMTATPIPRTLAMTVYGDLDVSIINELPPGRKPVKTVHRTDTSRTSVFNFLKQEIAKGRQVYVVYPLIEESEESDLKSLMEGFEAVSRWFPLPDYAVSVVHGKLPPDLKDYEMQRFLKGETDIMVATTVIEVGVNVPNATVMVIENAERFGLAQLHQLRGRVGRGAEQSYCILMTGEKLSYPAQMRIKIMCQTNDGFVIAEEDLRLRGPGDIDGTRQSGDLVLKIADLSHDAQLLHSARLEAGNIIESDPYLQKPEHSQLRTFLASETQNSLWAKIS